MSLGFHPVNEDKREPHCVDSLTTIVHGQLQVEARRWRQAAEVWMQRYILMQSASNCSAILNCDVEDAAKQRLQNQS
jgi:hypothetical protein